MSGLAYQPSHSNLSAKNTHEFCLGAGLVLTNRKPRPHILENFPFCIKFDKNKANKALRSNILQTTMRDYDFAALAGLGIVEPRYLSFSDEIKVLTFRAAKHVRIPIGFALVNDILVYCDSYMRIIVPTFDAVMYMIAIDEGLPDPLRVKAYISYSPALERNILRSTAPYFNSLEMALIGVERLVREQDREGGDYTPQSGTLSSCVQAKEAVQICVSDVLDTLVETATTPVGVLDPLLDWCELPKDPAMLALHLVTCRKPLYSIGAALATYVLVSFIRDFCLTLRFAFGFLAGCILAPKPKKPVSLFDSLYGPQAGILNSDDGSAFKGTQPQKTDNFSGASAPASRSAPGTSVNPTLGFSQPVRTAPPKPTKKDPNDGPLNGFGVGI